MPNPDETSPGPPATGSHLLAGLRTLPPNVVKTGIISFFADVSSEMLYPLIPIFLTVVLGAPVAVLGLVADASDGTALGGQLVVGRARR